MLGIGQSLSSSSDDGLGLSVGREGGRYVKEMTKIKVKYIGSMTKCYSELLTQTIIVFVNSQVVPVCS